MAKPWEKYQSEGPWDKYRTELPAVGTLKEEGRRAKVKGVQRGLPDPSGLQRGVATIEGDKIDVQHVGAIPKVAGTIGGRVKVGESRVPADPARPSAGMGPRIKAAFTHDTEAQKRVFAKARGIDPGMYRTLPGGQLVYPVRDERGIVYHFETPPGSAGGAVKGFGARAVSDAPIIIGETVGLVTGGIPGMAGGAMAGEVVKRGIARLALGEKQDPVEDYVLRPLTTGAISGVSGAVGKLAGPGMRTVDRVRRKAQGTGQVGKIVRHKEKVDVPGMKARAAAADKFELRPGTARLAKSPLLADVHVRYGKSASRAGEMIRTSERQLEKDIEQALVKGKGGMPKFSPPGREWVKGREARQTAGELYDSLFSLRRVKAEPHLIEASKQAKGKMIPRFKTVKKIEELIESTGEQGTVQLWNEIKKDLGGKTSFGKLDELRKGLMRRIDKTDPFRRGKKVSQGLKEIEEALRSDIAAVAGPSYHKGLKVYGAYSKKLKVFEESLLNTVREMPIDKLGGASKTLFGEGVTPQSVGRWKRLVINRVKGGEAKWNKMMEGGLADHFSDILKNHGISDQKMRVLEAGLSPKKFRAVGEFNKIVQDAGFLPTVKFSPTEQAGQQALEQGLGGVSRLMRFLSPSPLVWSGEATGVVVDKVGERVARELITGDGVKKLSRLKQFSPQSVEFAKQISALFGSQAGRHGVARIREE